MADQNPTGRASLDPFSPASEDKRTESAVLALLLNEHPTRLTMDELILVLHAGRVIEAGKHAELTARRGFYARLVDHQMASVAAAN